MTSQAASAEPYNGVILSMNVWGGAEKDSSQKRQTLIQAGILDAWSTAGSPRPTAILLQEFKYADRSLKPVLDALEIESGAPWQSIRQWSDGNYRDAVVLYNTAEFEGKGIAVVKYMKEASSKADINRILGDAIDKESVSSYITRWAGVHLAPLKNNPSTPPGSKPKASRLQFLLVSYHGRERRRQVPKPRTDIGTGSTEDDKTMTTLKTPIKKILARDFVHQVALESMHTTFAYGVHNAWSRTKGLPALIAGDWNADFDVFENFESYDPPLWKCQAAAPVRTKPHLSVRTTSDGELKSDIDYVVAVNPTHDHELSCDVKVVEVHALVHKEKYRKNKVFDHDPLLVHFCVKPRYPDGRKSSVLSPEQVSETRQTPQRVAALVAIENIRKLSGKEMKKEAQKDPTSTALDLDSASIYSDESSSPVEAPPAETAAAVQPLQQQQQSKNNLSEEQQTMVLFRCPKSYDLTKSTKDYTLPQLKTAVKAMALDALGVENARGKNINKGHKAFEQPWWPKTVTRLVVGDFDNSLTDEMRCKLYDELRAVLLARGIGAEESKEEMVLANGTTAEGEEEAPAQGNILSAKGLGRIVKKGLTRLVSREMAREP